VSDLEKIKIDLIFGVRIYFFLLLGCLEGCVGGGTIGLKIIVIRERLIFVVQKTTDESKTDDRLASFFIKYGSHNCRKEGKNLI